MPCRLLTPRDAKRMEQVAHCLDSRVLVLSVRQSTYISKLYARAMFLLQISITVLSPLYPEVSASARTPSFKLSRDFCVLVCFLECLQFITKSFITFIYILKIYRLQIIYCINILMYATKYCRH